MTTEPGVTSCRKCGARLNEPHNLLPETRQPCPTCGSRDRRFNLHVRDTVTLLEKFRFVQKRPGHKRPIRELVDGDDYHELTKQWNQLYREFDRLNNRYREKIVDPRTWTVIREVDEPLTNHVNRGSAKKKVPGEGSGA